MSTDRTPQTNEGQPPTLAAAVSLDRITELEPLMTRLSRIWAIRTGEDADELYSSFHFEIAQHALLHPDFLGAQNTANFIVTYGVYRTLDNYRRRKNRDASAHAQSLDEEGLDEMIGAAPAAPQPAASLLLATLLDNLDANSRELVEAIAAAGEEILFDKGDVNISALARQMGMPVRTINRRMRAMQRRARALLGDTLTA